MLKISTLKKYQWVWQAFYEAWHQPFGRKLKHLWYRLQWELRPALKWARKVPLAVDIELAAVCNFRCTFCQQSTGWYEEWHKAGKVKPYMDWETVKRIVDECARIGVYSMKLNWRGEPMLCPHFVDAILYMKQHGIHEVQCNTNASKLTEDITDRIIAAGIDRVIFSCDGISKETYNTLRRGGDFDIFMRNVRMFRERCNAWRDLGKRVPIVRINVAIQEANKHEADLFPSFFNGIADELRVNTVYNPQMRNKLLGSEHRITKRKGCPQIYQRMIVSAEGDAVPCCADYLKQINLGNVHEKSLAQMYNGKQASIRTAHERNLGRTIPGCRNCDLFSLSSLDDSGNVVWTDVDNGVKQSGC